MATPTPWGNPFIVNTTIRGEQNWNAAASFGNGSFITVWTDEGGEDDEIGVIRGQIFNADGTKKGGEFVVGRATDDSQDTPVVAVLADGRFVVSWAEYTLVDSSYRADIRARIFNADGTPFNRGEDGTDDFLVNITTHAGSQEHPVITALSNGGFVIGYTNADGYRTQAFDARGLHSGSEVLVNSEDVGSGQEFSIVQTGNSYAVFYSARVDDGTTIKGRIIPLDGSAPGSEFQVSNEAGNVGLPTATSLSNGRILVTWVTGGPTPSNHAQILNADGTKWGGEFRLDIGVASGQSTVDATALPNGGFATVSVSTEGMWELAATGSDVYVSIFDAAGNRVYSNLKVGRFDGPMTSLPTLTTLPDGRLFVTWTNAEGTDESNVFGQIVDPRLNGTSVAGTVGNDDYYGTAFDDSLAGAAGNDKLTGEAGNDILDGGTGADTMSGGLGNDTYQVDNAGDQVTELAGGGTDTVISSISYLLGAELENLTGFGSGALRLTGNAAANVITGADGKDRLDGGLGTDTLSGGTGNDVLIGGKGKDVFVFAAKLGTDKTDRKVNFDSLSDFKLKEDKIHLENAVFAKLKKPGKLGPGFFSFDKAKDKNDHIIYDKAKGVLSYDVDGSGSKKAVEFAKVKAKLNLSAADFLVI